MKKQLHKFSKSFLRKTETGHLKNSVYIKIVLLSVLGFIVTGLVGYPFQTDWDNSHLLAEMLSNGHPTYNNWLGWLYPSLCYWCYCITSLPLAIGIFNNLAYWISVSLFCIALFGNKRHPLFWYVLVAFFPGSLAFITSITNNATFFAVTFWGISLYIFYRKICRRTWLMVVSILLLVSTLFIRREALLFVPLVVIYICVTDCCRRYGKSFKTIFAGLASALVFLSFCFLVENRLTLHVNNYRVINTIGFTALFDLNGISHLKGEVVIPRHIFKDDNLNETLINEVVLKSGDDFFNDGGEGCFWCNDNNKTLLKQSGWLTDLTPLEIVPIYLDNFKYYLQFRLIMLKKYMYTQFFTVYGQDDTLEKNNTRIHSYITMALGSTALLIGIVLNFVWLAIIMLCFSLNGYVKYRDKIERNICNAAWGLLILIILLYVATAPSIQIRYVYPPCLFIWYLGIYTASLMIKKEIDKVE